MDNEELDAVKEGIDEGREAALDVLFPKSAEKEGTPCASAETTDPSQSGSVIAPVYGSGEQAPRITEALQTAAQLIRSKIDALNSDNTLDGSKKGINIVGTRLYIMGMSLAEDMDDFAKFLHTEGLE